MGPLLLRPKAPARLRLIPGSKPSPPHPAPWRPRVGAAHALAGWRGPAPLAARGRSALDFRLGGPGAWCRKMSRPHRGAHRPADARRDGRCAGAPRGRRAAGLLVRKRLADAWPGATPASPNALHRRTAAALRSRSRVRVRVRASGTARPPGWGNGGCGRPRPARLHVCLSAGPQSPVTDVLALPSWIVPAASGRRSGPGLQAPPPALLPLPARRCCHGSERRQRVTDPLCRLAQRRRRAQSGWHRRRALDRASRLARASPSAAPKALPDLTVYELHVRDFSVRDLPAPLRGT